MLLSRRVAEMRKRQTQSSLQRRRFFIVPNCPDHRRPKVVSIPLPWNPSSEGHI